MRDALRGAPRPLFAALITALPLLRLQPSVEWDILSCRKWDIFGCHVVAQTDVRQIE